ncbi:LysR family transcriptional regulator [Streptomyces mangrovisoli]|uniref:LysR family transcriptional regulator n=1 Tax=Streptomyces mangrovisoli TaxID=1428628 RepID=A0A1J4P2V7_9ACTN|nr:LysR family transcriptional regulator [Streptomyces mangrovisoli]OIJ68947.1 LysR family transcriptional regulator [Streptomyces mangrovisoli]
MPASSDPPPDLDLRLVRYFIVVAEQLHFGRAADALHLAQPSLSRQIRRLETLIGARLLDRTPRGTRLTPAGEAFLPEARALLEAAARAAARAQGAARPSRLTLGYTTGIIVTPAVRELRHRFPQAEVTALHLQYHEPRAALLDHRVDAVVSRLAFATDGLAVVPLYEEPRVLVVPLTHRLAGKGSVTLDDISGEPVPRLPEIGAGPSPRGAGPDRADPCRDGHGAEGRDDEGPFVTVTTYEDKIEVVAAGQAVAVAPASARSGLRADLTTVPIADVEPFRVVLVTREGDGGPLLDALRRIAPSSLTGERQRTAE